MWFNHLRTPFCFIKNSFSVLSQRKWDAAYLFLDPLIPLPVGTTKCKPQPFVTDPSILTSTIRPWSGQPAIQTHCTTWEIFLPLGHCSYSERKFWGSEGCSFSHGNYPIAGFLLGMPVFLMKRGLPYLWNGCSVLLLLKPCTYFFSVLNLSRLLLLCLQAYLILLPFTDTAFGFVLFFFSNCRFRATLCCQMIAFLGQ